MSYGVSYFYCKEEENSGAYKILKFAKSNKIDGKNLYLKLKEKGILVRHFDTDRIREYIRITIGNSTQMQAFISAIKEILEEL